MSQANSIAAVAAKVPWLRWMMQGIGGGGVLGIAYASIKAVENRPEFLPQLLSGGALSFMALVVGMFIFDRRMQQFTELSTRHVAAQEQLASGVNALAMKNDAKERETQLVLDELAENSKVTRDGLRRLIGKLYPGEDFDV